LVVAFCSIAVAEEAIPSVWFVSTRCAPHCGDLHVALSALRFWRMDDCDWKESASGAFQTAFDGPTVVFIPGNRSDADNAMEEGFFLRSLLDRAAEGKAFRFVIWDWPADRVCRRNRSDAQLKVNYSYAESYYLAAWLDRLQPGAKVSLVGYSLGARIIAGAMHLLAGGEVEGRSLPPETVAAWKGGKRNPVRAVLMAAAMDADNFSSCRQGNALSLLDRALVTENGCDRALRWYPRLWGRNGPEAMGYVGPCDVCAENVEVVDLTCSVGKSHDYGRYCEALDRCCPWARYVFFADVPTATVP
jgi:pimeloyl-ACP methyl ester carboxylesterase